jgi:LysR family carnitine catabolism transcriptional activator
METRRFKQLRFRQLRAFVELSSLGSFASVAEKLELSVPSVWQQIRALEKAFGCELVHTEGRRLVFTDRGQLLINMASPLVKGFDELVQTFSHPPEETRKWLSLAAPNIALTNELPGPLDRFRREYPDVELRLVDRGSAACIELVENGEVDMAIAGRLDEHSLPALKTERVTRYPFVFICRTDHELADAARLSLKKIARHPFVIPGAGTNARVRFDEVLTQADLRQRLQVVMEANTKELLLSYVQMGFGVAIASMSPVAMQRMAGEGGRGPLVFHDMSRLFGHENINLFVRRSRYQPAHEKAFCDILMEACNGRRIDA